jgi:hypothetical protein
MEKNERTKKLNLNKNLKISDTSKASYIIDKIKNSIFKRDATFKEIMKGLIQSIENNMFPTFLNSLYNAFNDEEWYKNKKKEFEDNHKLLNIPKKEMAEFIIDKIDNSILITNQNHKNLSNNLKRMINEDSFFFMLRGWYKLFNNDDWYNKQIIRTKSKW